MRRGIISRPSQQELGFGAAMGFDVADDYIYTFALALAAGLQHGIGLAYTCDHAKEDFEFAALPL